MGYKILSLTAENVKKLTAIHIEPNGNVVTIAGKNAQGKTTILECIWWALEGTKNIQAQPIKRGAKKARIVLDMGELVIERKFTESGSTLIVENAEGSRFPSPQKMLDALLGALSFDPLEFSRMEPRKQYDELRRIADIDIDIDALELKNRSDYDKRTEVNRDAKSKRAQAEAIAIPAGLPTARVDETGILDRIESAGEKNGLIETRRRRREDSQKKADEALKLAARLDAEVVQLQEKIANCQKQAADERAKAAELNEALKDATPLPQPDDIGVLRAELDRARTTNKAFEAVDRKKAIEREAEALEKRAEELTTAIDTREAEKTNAIARAKMPIPSLGFGNGIVLYQDVPFEQASAAEKIKVSFAIAMASNPQVKVVLIKDASLLDENSLQHIAAMAEEHDYQVWLERVDTTGQMGFVIEDGAVVAVDGVAVGGQSS